MAEFTEDQINQFKAYDENKKSSEPKKFTDAEIQTFQDYENMLADQEHAKDAYSIYPSVGGIAGGALTATQIGAQKVGDLYSAVKDRIAGKTPSQPSTSQMKSELGFGEGAMKNVNHNVDEIFANALHGGAAKEPLPGGFGLVGNSRIIQPLDMTGAPKVEAEVPKASEQINEKIAQRANSALEKIAGHPMASAASKIGAGAATGYNLGDAYRHYQQGEYGPAAVNALGAIGSTLGFAKNPYLKGIGLLTGLGAPMVNETTDAYYKSHEPKHYAPGGPVIEEAANLIKNPPSIKGLKEAFDRAIANHTSLDPIAQKANVIEANQKLMPYIGSKSGIRSNDLLSKNLKLQKAEKGFEGGAPITLPDGRGVETTGLSLAPAYQEGKFSTCPNSKSCKESCLGLTSGGNFQYGGGSDLEALKGPRLAHYNKTQAFLNEPDAFAVKLHDEIGKAKTNADANGNLLGVRLNTLSDIHPKVYESLMKEHPEVNFYDYTKLDTDAIAPNHHLTYSSTGVSQPELGINNPHQNWNTMRRRLDNGDNITMVFSNKKELPKTVTDGSTGKTYNVVSGDEHDFRPLDSQAEGSNGVVVGLKNKAMTSKADDAAKKSNGFMVHFDPSNGDSVTIPKQDKSIIDINPVPAMAIGGSTSVVDQALDPEMYLQQFPNYHHYEDNKPMIQNAVGLSYRHNAKKPKGFAPGGSVKTLKELIDMLPKAENSARTQISGTLPTYLKARDILKNEGVNGKIIDIGSGKGLGSTAMKADSFEPYPQGWHPTFTDINDVPSDAYQGMTNFNVLNVLHPEMRDEVVSHLGRVMEPGGTGLVTTRGKDVMNTIGGRPGPEPMSVITSRDTYQKGFTNPELQDYLKYILGDKYDYSPLSNLGSSGVMLKKK